MFGVGFSEVVGELAGIVGLQRRGAADRAQSAVGVVPPYDEQLRTVQ
ncbi:hypothetical protein J7I98_33780 [Streptomyces sp. ISL-98]|nr:hypothetical protein [Streptomyces sp. ISL-98]MBT2510715.1 hypothetical protein [Streptomyces sp. ISL-98]